MKHNRALIALIEDVLTGNTDSIHRDYIAEAAVEGKNVHAQHIEDSPLYQGATGIKNAIAMMKGVLKKLKGHADKRYNLSVKVDGAPAIFCGIDPADGKFFVAKKGIFNKNPKVYKSVEDVHADTEGDLADKLSIAFTELSKLGIKGVIQGDMMFVHSDLKKQTIDGEEYITFHPNTIVYAVPASSHLAREIEQAKVGVIFHTSYSGPSLEAMKAQYKIDLSKLKKVPSVWISSAELPDVAGTATLSKEETAKIQRSIDSVEQTFSEISPDTLSDLHSDQELAGNIETFNNILVRKGEKITDPKKHASALIKWMHDRFDKDKAEKKTDKGKAAVDARREQRMKFFSPKNIDNLALIFKLQMEMADTKKMLIDKLDEVQSLSTFLKRKDGSFDQTGSEGFMISDQLTDNAVKLVDRNEFSRANFSPEYVKGFDKRN